MKVQNEPSPRRLPDQAPRPGRGGQAATGRAGRKDQAGSRGSRRERKGALTMTQQAVERDEQAVERDEQAVGPFIERFASVLVEAGIPPMPARVFSALLVTDSGRLTAAGLTELLGASPAAISGAVRYLEHVGMIGREREPGSRRDVYLLRNDLWYEMTLGRDPGPADPGGQAPRRFVRLLRLRQAGTARPAGTLAGPPGAARLAAVRPA